MKTKSTAILFAIGLGASATTWAGPYDQPYALFQARAKSAAQDLAPATVMKVDGQNTKKPGRSDPVPPGKHAIEVSVPGAKGVSNPDRQTLEIDAKPCTRYFLAAKRSSPTAKDWQAFVEREESIGECKAKFMKDAPKK